MPRVHVAVVNWNTAPAALDSAAAYRASRGVSVKLTLVDNASAPEDQLLLRRGVGDDPEVDLQLEPRNLGYGAAANRALQATEAELVCVSNADVVPDPDMLRHLAAAALGDPSLALLAPRLHGPGGYHARLPKGYTLPLRAFAGSVGHRAVNLPPGGELMNVEQPAGACLLARTEVWRRLGGFDPGFFLWFEDVDLARRSSQFGCRNVVVGAAVANHTGGQSFALIDGATRQRIWLASLERYTAKHHPRFRRITRSAVLLAALLPTRERCAPQLPPAQASEFTEGVPPRLDHPHRAKLGK